MFYRKPLLAGLLVAALAACGHSSQSSQSSASSQTGSYGGSNGVMTNQSAHPSPSSAAYPPMGGTDTSGNAMAPGTLATIPPTVQCGADQPVWVNLRSHVYHVASDPLYGRTRHGKYMCLADAKAQGFHAARGRSATQP